MHFFRLAPSPAPGPGRAPPPPTASRRDKPRPPEEISTPDLAGCNHVAALAALHQP